MMGDRRHIGTGPWLVLAGGAALAALAAGADNAGDDPGRSQYSGQESRQIKSLSSAEELALRSGEAMGLARAAELNGYPGPRHVLALIAELRSGLRYVHLEAHLRQADILDEQQIRRYAQLWGYHEGHREHRQPAF